MFDRAIHYLGRLNPPRLGSAYSTPSSGGTFQPTLFLVFLRNASARCWRLSLHRTRAAATEELFADLSCSARLTAGDLNSGGSGLKDRRIMLAALIRMRPDKRSSAFCSSSLAFSSSPSVTASLIAIHGCGSIMLTP